MFDLDPPKHSSRSLWIAAALGAVAIHAGGIVLALASMPQDDPADVGARAIEISIELAAPHLEQSERPVGPDSEAAAPSPAQIEAKAVVEHTDLPKAIPTETDDPDRVVAPTDTPKPKEDEPKITTVETVSSIAAAASEETATPSLEKAPEAPRSVAPAAGNGESTQRARVTWQKELAAHLDKYKRYPADRDPRSIEVVVSFVLDRSGHVISTRVLKGLWRFLFRRGRACHAATRRSGPSSAATRRRRGTDLHPARCLSHQRPRLTAAADAISVRRYMVRTG